jgi:hypothetical protein
MHRLQECGIDPTGAECPLSGIQSVFVFFGTERENQQFQCTNPLVRQTKERTGFYQEK